MYNAYKKLFTLIFYAFQLRQLQEQANQCRHGVNGAFTFNSLQTRISKRKSGSCSCRYQVSFHVFFLESANDVKSMFRDTVQYKR